MNAGLAYGTIEAIATDHAPDLRRGEGAAVRRGAAWHLALETALALTITELVGPGSLDLPRALALLSWQPARLGRAEADDGGPVIPGDGPPT